MRLKAAVETARPEALTPRSCTVRWAVTPSARLFHCGSPRAPAVELRLAKAALEGRTVSMVKVETADQGDSAPFMPLTAPTRQ